MAKSSQTQTGQRDPARIVSEALFRSVEAVHRAVGKVVLWIARRVDAIIARLPWPLRMAGLAAALAVIAGLLGPLSKHVLFPLIDLPEEGMDALKDAGLMKQLLWLQLAGYAAAGLLVLVAGLGFVRHKVGLYAQHAGVIGFGLLWLWLLVLITDVPSTLHSQAGNAFGESQRNAWYVTGWSIWLPVVLIWGVWALCLRYSPLWRFYHAERTADEPRSAPRRAGDKLFAMMGTDRQERQERLGDRVFQDLRTGGRDPEFRKSTLWAVVLHLLVFVGPLLIRGCWLMTPYEIPKGSGKEVVEVVQVQRVQPPERQFVLNLNSPIIYYIPDSKDSDVLKEVTEQTEMEYEASQITPGKIGEGGGDTGGWPDGMEDARVRFIRLKYNGADWDQNMGQNADHNLLLYFSKLTGFKIASDTEAVTASQLARFPSGKAPPFIYLTGTEGSINLSGREIRLLREYCLEEGGMIFADNGYRIDRSFRNLVRQLFPGKPLVDIADDDPIYQQPFLFPNGAPPLWGHSGSRALGVKHHGRWVVFYHQGDIGDAWKTGHSGISTDKAMRAYKMGINVMYYAFTRYLAQHRD